MVEFHERALSDGGSVLAVAGEFDLAVVDAFLERALALLDSASALELDLQRVSFIDSSGLGALVRVRKEAAERDKAVSLVNVSPATHRLLEITGLHQAFDITPRQD